MPRSEKTKAAVTTVDEASRPLSLGLVEELAEPVAEYMLANCRGAIKGSNAQTGVVPTRP